MLIGIVLAKQRLVGTEVSDVVAGKEHEVGRVLLRVRAHASEHREDFDHLIGLEEQVGLVGGATHRHRHRDLPPGDAELDEPVDHRLHLAQRVAGDLRVGGHAHPEISRVAHRSHRRGVAPFLAAKLVVQLLERVDRDTDERHPGGLRFGDSFARHLEPAGEDADVDAALVRRPRDVEPPAVEVALAADQRDLLRAHRVKIVDDAQRLCRGELVRARLPRA